MESSKRDVSCGVGSVTVNQSVLSRRSSWYNSGHFESRFASRQVVDRFSSPGGQRANYRFNFGPSMTKAGHAAHSYRSLLPVAAAVPPNEAVKVAYDSKGDGKVVRAIM